MIGHSAAGPGQRRRSHTDAACFDAWVDAHASELYRFAYRLCGEAAAAEDLVQESFYEAWKHPRPLRTVREPQAWLFLILRRRYFRLRRTAQRRPWHMTRAPEDIPSAGAAPPEERFERTDSLQRALDGMSDLYKLPLLMVFAQGMSCARAADELDLPLGTVLSRIHRAKNHLRDAIIAQDEGRTQTIRNPDSTPGGHARLRIVGGGS